MAVYNADDERIIFCGDGSSGPCRWTLRGNGDEVLREYESGPIGNGNSFWSYYLWVEDTVYRGSLLAGAQRETAEGGRLYFHLDHLGSPRLTTNAAGQKVTANEFAPFGRELTSITQETQLGYDRTETHRFTGHERDFVEGTSSDNVNFVDYMHARTYLPVFGRFVSVDPELGSAARPQSWNRYAYVLNNPINATDPSGNCETKNGDRLPCSDMEITVEATTPTPLEQALSNALDIALDTTDMTVFDAVKPGLMVMDSFRTDNVKEFALGTGGLVASGAFGGAMSALTKPATTIGVSLLENAAVDAAETTAVGESLQSTSRALYSHAAKAMDEHGVTRAMVEKAVEVGEKFYDPKNNSLVYVIRNGMATGKDLAVALDPFTGAVKTVMVNLKAVRPRFVPLP
jgi:RHS repeat-associated protein